MIYSPLYIECDMLQLNWRYSMHKYQEALAFLEKQDALEGGGSYFREISDMLRELIQRIDEKHNSLSSITTSDPWRAESERIRRSSQAELGEATKNWSKSEKKSHIFYKGENK